MRSINATEAQKTLFSLVGHNLFGTPLEIGEGVDWSAVIKESAVQTLSLIAFNNYRDLPLDDETAFKLAVYLKRCTATNIRCFKGHAYLHKLLTENGVPYCIIKGVASAARYPDPLLRNMGDVDFYVRPEDIPRAKEIFLAEGFKFEEGEHPFHLGMVKGMLCAEMHFAPISSPRGEIGEIFTEYWSDICEKAVLTRDDFAEYNLPSDFHHGFVLLTHLRSHLLQSGVGLRHLCDWAVFVNSFSNESFVELFRARLKRVGLWRFAQIASLASVILFGMPHKAWMGDDYDTATAIAEDIVEAGNFGKKDADRVHDRVFVREYKFTGKKRRGLARAFSAANAMVAQRWSAAKKCPILYPIGWVYFSIRLFFKKITGKHKGHLLKSYARSGKRVELYSTLRIFEPEE